MAGAGFEEYPGKVWCKMLIGLSGYIGAGKDEVAKMVQFFTRMSPSKRDFGVYQGGTWQLHMEHPTWEIKKFAGKLKQIVSLLTGIPVADLEKESVKASELPKEWDYIAKAIQLESRHWITIPGPVLPTMEDRAHKLTVRKLLQLMGTDACRNIIHENIWVNSLFVGYKDESEQYYTGIEDSGVKETAYEKPVYPNWIISDCRYPNEAQAIKDRGGIVVRINRPIASGSKMIDKIGEFKVKGGLHASETSLDTWEFDYIIDNSGTIEELLEQVRTMLLHFKIIT